MRILYHIFALYDNIGAMTIYSDDKQLMRCIREGDIKAFDNLFRRYYPKLLAYATQFVDGPEAENVVQDIMLSLWERRLEINLKHSVSTYLHSAVKNKCYTLITRGHVKEKVVSAIRLSLIEEALDTDPYTLRELGINLQKAICDLPDHLRTTFELSRLEGKKYAEIAEIQHVSVKTVEYRVAQAIRILRTRLSDYLPLLGLLLTLDN